MMKFRNGYISVFLVINLISTLVDMSVVIPELLEVDVDDVPYHCVGQTKMMKLYSVVKKETLFHRKSSYYTQTFHAYTTEKIFA